MNWEFVHKMDNAYALDMEAFARGEVVDNRLKMIKEVERTMCNTDLAKLFVFLFKFYL